MPETSSPEPGEPIPAWKLIAFGGACLNVGNTPAFILAERMFTQNDALTAVHVGLGVVSMIAAGVLGRGIYLTNRPPGS